MLPLALFHLLAVACSASWTQALPLYPHLEPRTEFFQSLASGGRNGGEDEHRDGAGDLWSQGEKDSLQQNRFTDGVDDLQDLLLKLAAADTLRSHSFIRSEQNLPKANKRACFWKYCVTN